MTVIESVRELGKAIQKDERFIRYAKAKLANDTDTVLQAAIGKFNIARMNLENESAKEDRDEVMVKKLNDELREIYGEIMSNPVMVEFNTAKVGVDQMMTEVNVIISKCLDGEDPETCTTDSGCTGSCSTCGGCH